VKAYHIAYCPLDPYKSMDRHHKTYMLRACKQHAIYMVDLCKINTVYGINRINTVLQEEKLIKIGEAQYHMPSKSSVEPPKEWGAPNKINLLHKRIKNRINKRWYPDRLRPQYTGAHHRKGNHAGIARDNRFQDNYKELEREYDYLEDRCKRLKEMSYQLQSQYTELKARFFRLKRRYDRLKRDVDELFYRLTVVSWIVAILTRIIEFIRAIREIVKIFAS